MRGSMVRYRKSISGFCILNSACRKSPAGIMRSSVRPKYGADKQIYEWRMMKENSAQFTFQFRTDIASGAPMSGL
jgi:hypothetical protein